MNPHPGKLQSKPGGPNLYDGLKVDYKGGDINPQNILAVLTGDASALNATTGDGKVLKR
jgi:legumain